MSTVFGVQLGLAVVAGLLVVFCLVLQGAGQDELLAVAERPRAAIAGHRFTLPGKSQASQITASLGAALYPQDGGSYQQAVNKADERLYRAKQVAAARWPAPRPLPGGCRHALGGVSRGRGYSSSASYSPAS